MSYFGGAKFMGNSYGNKDAIQYLAPKLYASQELIAG